MSIPPRLRPSCSPPASISARSPNGSRRRRSAPAITMSIGRAIRAYWQLGADLLGRLPNKPARSPGEARAAQSILAAAREQREHFLAAHAETLYDELTHQRSRFIRLEDLVFAAADGRSRPDADRRASRRRGRALAARKGRRRDRPGHFPRACARQRNRRPASVPRHAVAAARRPPSICKNSPPTAASISARFCSSAAARRRS